MKPFSASQPKQQTLPVASRPQERHPSRSSQEGLGKGSMDDITTDTKITLNTSLKLCITGKEVLCIFPLVQCYSPLEHSQLLRVKPLSSSHPVQHIPAETLRTQDKHPSTSSQDGVGVRVAITVEIAAKFRFK